MTSSAFILGLKSSSSIISLFASSQSSTFLMLSSPSIDIAILNALSNSSLNCGASPSIDFRKLLINSNSNSLAILAMSTSFSSFSTSSAKSFAPLLALLLSPNKGFSFKNLLYSCCISKLSLDKLLNSSLALFALFKDLLTPFNPFSIFMYSLKSSSLSLVSAPVSLADLS